MNKITTKDITLILGVTFDTYLLSRKVSIYCPQCQGNHVNWDQSFSVSAVCEDCNIPAKLIQYTWSLYLVNASSKPVIEGKQRQVIPLIIAYD